MVRATPLVQHRGVFTNLSDFCCALPSSDPVLCLDVQDGRRPRWEEDSWRRSEEAGESRSVRRRSTDVAGIDEVEAEINEVVDFLRIRGSTGSSEPGRQKVCCCPDRRAPEKRCSARATAGEANVPFFSASASEFIEMIVGVGASRVRELFAEARKVAPAIIFIDEIDTIGRTRGGMRSVVTTSGNRR